MSPLGFEISKIFKLKKKRERKIYGLQLHFYTQATFSFQLFDYA